MKYKLIYNSKFLLKIVKISEQILKIINNNVYQARNS